MPETTVKLKFEIGDQHLSIDVTDKNSFMGTLRNLRGVAAVSSDGNNLVVELDEHRIPTCIIADIKRIYPQLNSSPVHAP